MSSRGPGGVQSWGQLAPHGQPSGPASVKAPGRALEPVGLGRALAAASLLNSGAQQGSRGAGRQFPVAQVQDAPFSSAVRLPPAGRTRVLAQSISPFPVPKNQNLRIPTVS